MSRNKPSLPSIELPAMFKRTEPEPTPEQSTAGSNVPDPLPGMESYVTEPEPEKKKLKPQSVYLTKADLAWVQKIADEYNESRHAVMQYAVKELIREYKRGKKFRTDILGKLDK